MQSKKSLYRVCIIHQHSSHSICLYDMIFPGEQQVWANPKMHFENAENTTKSTDLYRDDDDVDVEEEHNMNIHTDDENDEYAMGIEFPVSGSKRERMLRQELVTLIEVFFLVSQSTDTGIVSKACFQLPAETLINNFAVKFTPHFGTLSRPKRNINTKISSMVFSQALVEMVIASGKLSNNRTIKSITPANTNELIDTKSSSNPMQKRLISVELKKKSDSNSNINQPSKYNDFIAVVFYGPNCKTETASKVAQILIHTFLHKFEKQLHTLLAHFERKKELEEKEEKKEVGYVDDDAHMVPMINQFEQSFNVRNSSQIIDDYDANASQQESIMATFKSFDEFVGRLHTKYADRTHIRRESDSLINGNFIEETYSQSDSYSQTSQSGYSDDIHHQPVYSSALEFQQKKYGYY